MEPRAGFLTAGSGRLYVREYGAGPPIVVLHGGPDFDFDYLLPELDRLTAWFRVIYYDQRGRGRSAPGVRPDDVTVESEVEDLERVRRHAGLESIAVLGHSWGGVLALEYAARHPDRLTHLILLDTAPVSHHDARVFRDHLRRIRPAGDAEAMRALAASDRFRSGDLDVERDYYRLHYRPTLDTPELLDRLLPRLRTNFTPERVLLARAIEERLYDQTWSRADYDLLPRVRRLAVPTLVLRGEKDFVPGEVAAHITEAITAARLVVLPRCGHFAYLEAPAAVAEQIRDLFSAAPGCADLTDSSVRQTAQAEEPLPVFGGRDTLSMTTAVPAPDPVELADGLVEVLFEADPLRASLLGFHDRDAELPDLSDAAERALAGRLRELAAAAGRVDRNRLDPGDRLTVDVVRVVAADGADVAETRRPEWQVTDLWEGPAAAVLLYLPMVSLSEPAHADAYLQRLRSLDIYLGTAAERHLDGVGAGRRPVARLVHAAVDQVDNYLAAPDSDPLRGVERPAGWDGADRFGRKLDEVLADVVRPAFGRYRDRLADAVQPLSRSDEHVGLCWLPDGEELYRTLARTHTTTSRTPEDLHAAGLDLVARLAGEYAELGGRMFGRSDPAEVMRRLRDDPALRCSGAEQMLEEARRAVARAEEAAPRWFARRPGQPCAVRAVPAAEAARAPLAYYMPAALDGSRPGTYWQNTRDPAGQPRHILQVTAHHEAVPGHHFQNALAQGMREAPLLRRIVEFDAFDEGWALYSERLADEMGLFTDDLARFGMLAGDSLRASRLVVDTGMHALGWSRAEAVNFLRTNTPLAPADIEVEVDRYIAVPGQALAYMVGRLEIQRMRADAERRLGGNFDIRTFHDTVLGAGSLPLSILADQIDTWLRSEQLAQARGAAGQAAGAATWRMHQA